MSYCRFVGELFVSYITCVKLLNDDDDDYLIIISGDHNFLGTTLPSPCIFASSEIFLVNAFWQSLATVALSGRFAH